MAIANMFEDGAADFRYAGRRLRRSPAFTLVVVLTLAIGLGANTAIFSIVDQLLLDPLLYKRPDRLVRIFEEHAALGFHDFAVAPATLLTWREQATTFESIAFFVAASRNVVDEKTPDVLNGIAISTNLLPVLGVEPMLGRGFQQGDGAPGTGPVVVLSHELWKTRYASAPDVVGRMVRMDGQARTIVGVLPPSFQFPASTADIVASSFLIPRVLSPAEEGMRGNHFLRAIGRLKPGATVEQADAEMQKIAEKLERDFPNANKGWRVKLVDVRHAMNGDTSRAALLLLGASGLVLLIGCVNVASLLLARSSARQSELAIRFAIGASRGRIVRQLAVEYLLLALLGLLAGLLLAVWGKDLVLALAPEDVFNQVQSPLNIRILLFASLITLLTTFVFGFLPAARVWRGLADDHLKHGARLVSPPRGLAASQSRLIVAETAIAAILLFGGGVLSMSFVRLMSVEPGFNPRQVLSFRVRLASAAYRDVIPRLRAYDRILERLKTLPGVIGAAAATNAPFTGGGQNYSVKAENGTDQLVSTNYYSVSPGYFSAMRIPIRSGRAFSSEDRRDGAPVAIISDAIAKTLFGDGDPLGRRITGLGAPRTVVGIVTETKHEALDLPTRPQVYLPYTQDTQGQMTFVVRSGLGADGMASAIRKTVSEIDPELPVTGIRLMEDHISKSVLPARFTMALSGLFALLALLLAGVGIYGVLAFFVAERASEVGVRMALGATASDIVRLVVMRSVRPVAVGLVLAAAVSAATLRLIDRLVFQPKNSDAWLLLAVSAVILIVAFLSTYVPARRAARIEPMAALRLE